MRKNNNITIIKYAACLALLTGTICQPMVAMGTAGSNSDDEKKSSEKRRLTDYDKEENAHKRIKTPTTDVKTPILEARNLNSDVTTTSPQVITEAPKTSSTSDTKDAKVSAPNDVIPTFIAHPEEAYALCMRLTEQYNTRCNAEQTALTIDSKNAIIQAIANETLPDVLLAEPDPSTAQSPYNQALHFAASIDDIIVVKILLKAGININCTDELGHSAFWYAMLCNSMNVMTYLLIQYADMAGVTLSIL